MTNPCDRSGPQTIPEPAKKGHSSEFSGPGGDENIGFYASKYLKKGRNHRRVVLAIGIEGDDDLIAFLYGISEPSPKGRAFPQIEGVFQDRCPFSHCNHLRFVLGPVIYDNGLDPETLNLHQNLAKGSLSIVGWDKNTDSI
jgi:hypothetical protein